jgi:hypothetical protein
MGCQAIVVVFDESIGYCAKCSIELQEDKRLDRELGLTKDEPIKRKYIKSSKKSRSKKSKRKKKKL